MLQRDSNIELLRLVCMFLIVFQHCIHVYAFPEVWNTDVMSFDVVLASTLTGFAYIGVICFILISGYFGIKLKLRSALNIYIICAFYALIGYLLHLYIDGAHVGKGLLYHSVFCISHSKLWFVKCYVGLMLLSPILNTAMENMSKKTYQWVIGLLTILNVYFGFVWQDESFNANGYTIANFVYIYMIGGYIARYVSLEWCRTHKAENICIYLATSLLWAGAIVLLRYIHTPWDEWGYNNPFTLIGAISFFMLFLSMPKFHSKPINWLASGAFAVYLVHCGDYFDEWFKECVGQIAEWSRVCCGSIVTAMCMFLVSIIVLLFVCTIDKLRNAITQPIVDMTCNFHTHTHTHTHTRARIMMCRIKWIREYDFGYYTII